MSYPNLAPTGAFSQTPRSGDATEITLRDHFAGQVLNGIIAADADTMIRVADPNHNGHANLAKTCYQLADAMLAARNGVCR